jgi:hypothetical protein
LKYDDLAYALDLYEKGDINAAFLNFMLLAAPSNENPDAQLMVGYIYYMSSNLSGNLDNALKYFQLSAMQGHALAHYNLGVFYCLDHKGHPPNIEEARTHFIKAALFQESRNPLLLASVPARVDASWLRRMSVENLAAKGAQTVNFNDLIDLEIAGIEKLLCIFEVAPVNRTVLTSALQLKFTDFEDAVLHEAAVAIGIEAIVTRDVKGFLKSAIPVYSSDEFVASF